MLYYVPESKATHLFRPPPLNGCNPLPAPHAHTPLSLQILPFRSFTFSLPLLDRWKVGIRKKTYRHAPNLSRGMSELADVMFPRKRGRIGGKRGGWLSCSLQPTLLPSLSRGLEFYIRWLFLFSSSSMFLILIAPRYDRVSTSSRLSIFDVAVTLGLPHADSHTKTHTHTLARPVPF